MVGIVSPAVYYAYTEYGRKTRGSTLRGVFDEADNTITFGIATSTFPNWDGADQKRPFTGVFAKVADRPLDAVHRRRRISIVLDDALAGTLS